MSLLLSGRFESPRSGSTWGIITWIEARHAEPRVKLPSSCCLIEWARGRWCQGVGDRSMKKYCPFHRGRSVVVATAYPMRKFALA